MTGLYLHIPFCRKKCFYCSFIVAVSQNQHMNNYTAALNREMKSYQNFSFDSIYFGGGTPSQLSGGQFLSLMDHIRKDFLITPNAEFTVEMNPEDVTQEKLTYYQRAGVNRLSLGIQSFNDDLLKALGRTHDSAQAKNAFQLMRARGFDNVSVDLMYGFPDQTLKDIEIDLVEFSQLNSDHVSLYSLTIDQGSKFFVHHTPLPSQEAMADQYVFVMDYLISDGFEHYEVSNFSKSGKRSIHNINYWQGGNYIGLGVGAHSHWNGKRWWNVSKVREYIKAINDGDSVKEGEEDLSAQQRLSEALVFGLRMIDGVDLKTLQERFGRLSESQQQQIAQFVDNGFLELEGDRLRALSKGLLVLDDLAVKLMDD